MHTNMRNKHYKIKGIRMSEETWIVLKDKRRKSGKSWNRFLLDLIKKEKQETFQYSKLSTVLLDKLEL